jgi:sec-independent protein translocase protein TatA
MEIVVVLVLALLVFGPKRLPQAGRSLGHAMREFRKATQTARTELGLDEVAEGVNDLKSSLSIDLNSATAPAPRQAAAADVAPAADKPLPVAAAGSDTTPVEVPAAEAATEPAVAEPVAAEAAGDDTTAAGASAGRDDA